MRDTKTVKHAVHVCNRPPSWGKPCTTIREQQKDEGTVWAREGSQDKDRNFESSLWRLVRIKSSLEEVQAKAGNDNCSLG